MAHPHLNRLTPATNAVRDAAARLQRPKTIGVFCEHCQTWVKARRYNPVLYCCKDCEPSLMSGSVSQWRTAQQAAALTDHLHTKRTRAWRRQAALAHR